MFFGSLIVGASKNNTVIGAGLLITVGDVAIELLGIVRHLAEFYFIIRIANLADRSSKRY